MELKFFDIIKRPIVTNKTIDLFKKLGQITFEVHRDANKIMVRNAVENLWDVKVDKVRVINIHGKNKTFMRRSFTTSDKKKAIVTLKKGYKMDLPGMVEMVGPSAETDTVAHKNEKKN